MSKRVEREIAYKQQLRHLALRRQGWKCFYCTAPLTLDTATADHGIPKAAHGPTSADNIVAACEDCNKTKGRQLPLAFLSSIKCEQYHGRAELMIARMRRKIWLRAHQAADRVRGCLG